MPDEQFESVDDRQPNQKVTMPEVDAPGDPNVPKDSPLYRDLQPPDPDAEYIKQQEGIVQRVHDMNERHKKLIQPIIDRINDQVHTKVAEPVQAPLPQQQGPGLNQQQKGSASQAIMNIAIAALLAYSVFGRRHGHSGGQGAMMAGVGALMQGYMQGRKERMLEQKAEWHRLAELKAAENRERMQNYRELLANKRLDLAQQMDLIKMYSQLHEDDKMEAAAESKDIEAVHKNIAAKQKAYDRIQATVNARDANAKKNKAEWRTEWRALVREKSHGTIDPDKSSEDEDKAIELYPPSQFFRDKANRKEKAPSKAKKILASDNDPLELGIKKKSEQLPLGPTLGGGGGLLGTGGNGDF